MTCKSALERVRFLVNSRTVNSRVVVVCKLKSTRGEHCSLLHLALPVFFDLNWNLGHSVELDRRVLVEDGLVNAAAWSGIDKDDDVASTLTDVFEGIVRVPGHSLGPRLLLSQHFLSQVDGRAGDS